MKIVLARHGRPDVRRWPRIYPRQMQAWIASYDASGIAPVAPPARTVDAARNAGVVVSSTSRRAVESAQALAPGCRHLQDAVFCEAALPHTAWTFPRLPPAVWAAVFRIGWLLGFHGHAESLGQAKARARDAALRLVQLAQQADSVCLLRHGMMNRLIGKELAALGWQGPKRTATGYWETSTYTSTNTSPHPRAYART